ncbi:hypothetical protein [Engelhardtia mirabilis]|uniref:Taurine catabolism dioxygenase TauD, TfdA family n=1 Tax=Engelhardtia mirabilis TaxID=2528011 RepID=A0A518BRD8_9BACT|nr:hypothetical protein Pla133_46580 [Planctomycetes bacterium Pla133]QDV03864.1 hypothetical protein Pla86_46560 [Planctomycetes bacterium Pla86]
MQTIDNTIGRDVATTIARISVDPDRALAALTEIDDLHRANGSPNETPILWRLARQARPILSAHLPAAVAAVEAHSQPFGPCAVAIEGLAPTGSRLSPDAQRVLALALGSPLGSPFQYLQQNDGVLVPGLSPTPGVVANSGASPGPFAAHSDDAILPPHLRVRSIALFGVENETRVPTGYAPIEAILDRLDRPDRAILMTPDFAVRKPHSFDLDGGSWSAPLPLVFENAAGELCVQCPTYNTRPLGAAAARAFAGFRRAVDEALQWLVVGEGSYMVFRNDRGLHARPPIAGRRTVLRTYWRPDTASLQAATGQAGPVFDLRPLLAG